MKTDPEKDDRSSVPDNGTNIINTATIWFVCALVALTNFIGKSLCAFVVNVAVGCGHGCKFCYVPSTSVNKQKHNLSTYGVENPEVEWGDYVFPRPLDEAAFLKSLKKAENTPETKLVHCSHRAIMYCSTTDPYQVIIHPDKARLIEIQQALNHTVSRSLELIRDNSSLPVRILTRSPLARRDFGLMASFGNRLVFGMSVPTLNDELLRAYEPNAPGVQARLKTLEDAKAKDIPIYVAMAPTLPECDEADLRATLRRFKELEPITIFMEPINIRSENAKRIADHAAEIGVKLNTAVFATRSAWLKYALDQFQLVERIAREEGVIDRLHLWPDAQLASKSSFLEMRKGLRDPSAKLTKYQIEQLAQQDLELFAKLSTWVEAWHNRISEWPTYE